MQASAKYRNIAAQPEVAFVVDDAIGQGAEGMRMVEVRGPAQQATTVATPDGGDRAPIIRIHPRRVVSWNVDPALPGMQAQDLDPGGETQDPGRPALHRDRAGPTARAAVDRLVAELQAGLDGRDADLYNRHFAADVIWGSPYGAVVHGYEPLHAIHAGFHARSQPPTGPASRYEVVEVRAPAPGVALAQVRRQAFDADGNPVEATDDPRAAFSEMALYVLVRRGGTWWLAAGQNTPVRPRPA